LVFKNFYWLLTTKAPKEQQLRVQGLQVDDHQSSERTTTSSSRTSSWWLPELR
jgi:hypothetical protein